MTRWRIHRSTLAEEAQRPVQLANRPALAERLAGLAAVAGDGGNQLVEALVDLLPPDMTDQRDFQVPAVDVGIEIEQERLERRQLVVEHRLAVARDAIEQFFAQPRAHRVNALREPEARTGRDVGGRETKLTAALVALDHLAAEEPVVAEKIVGERDVALPQRLADARG